MISRERWNYIPGQHIDWFLFYYDMRKWFSYYSLGLFVVLTIVPIRYDTIVLTQLTAEIWEHSDITTVQQILTGQETQEVRWSHRLETSQHLIQII